MNAEDPGYIEIFLKPLRECAKYKPQLGGSMDEGVTITTFQTLYGADPLYNWIGLNSPLMYAAHKAAGGITSVYRQLGIGCERLVRRVIHDALAISMEDLKWGYQVEKENGTFASLTLDARIDCDHISDPAKRTRMLGWVREAGRGIGLSEGKCDLLKGAVFEVRQGYKSADAKRQNADLRNAVRAYSSDYLPVVMVVSSQINRTVLRRYRTSQILILVGEWEGSPAQNTFEFFHQIVGYDLKSFFERNRTCLHSEVEMIVRALLTPD